MLILLSFRMIKCCARHSQALPCKELLARGMAEFVCGHGITQSSGFNQEFTLFISRIAIAPVGSYFSKLAARIIAMKWRYLCVKQPY
jgi:hypothetical protein